MEERHRDKNRRGPLGAFVRAGALCGDAKDEEHFEEGEDATVGEHYACQSGGGRE